MPRNIFSFSWEDGALSALTAAWAAAPRGMAVFHAYTVGAMLFILSLGFRRGLAAGLSRTAAVCAAVFLSALYGPMEHEMWLEILSLASCGAFSGILGWKQRKAQDALEESFCQTLDALAGALEARDPYTQGHTKRTAAYAESIAGAMGLDAETRTVLGRAALLHDLGKIGTPDAILRKEGPLTPAERGEINRHPADGARILRGVAFLRGEAELVRHHHESYDGSGYPDGLAGGAIPLGARILAAADTLDAMTTDRPYRKGLSFSEARAELERRAGAQFDPAVIEALKRAAPAGTGQGDL